MKKPLLLLLGVLMLSACSGRPVAPEYPQLVMGPNARHYLQIESVQQGVASGDLLRAGVRLINTSGYSRTLRYRMVWLDSAGFELAGLASRWEQAQLRPNEQVSLSRIAPSAQAHDYRIYLFDLNTPSTTRGTGN